jgi:hypothetical protein
MYFGPHFALPVLVAQGSPTVPPTPYEELMPTSTEPEEATPTVLPTPYERLIPTPTAAGQQMMEPVTPPDIAVDQGRLCWDWRMVAIPPPTEMGTPRSDSGQAKSTSPWHEKVSRS